MNTQKLFDFLNDLQENNSKSWMDANRGRYHELRDEFIAFIDRVNNCLTKAYPGYTDTPGKKAIERINNNLMFHPERPTYKDHFGATLDKVMKGSDFYLCLGVGAEACFIGGGMWHPGRKDLEKIRAAIDYDGHQLKKILSKSSFRKTFGDIYREDSLKTSPQNYDKDHEHIDLLKLKSFVVLRNLTLDEVNSDNFSEQIVELYGEFQPFLQYLRRAVLFEEE